MNPIPLSSPKGEIYAYACGECHHVSAGASTGVPEIPGPVEILVKLSLEQATSCCICRECGGMVEHDEWGLTCKGCDSWRMFCWIWRTISRCVELDITSQEAWRAYIDSDDEE